MATASHSTHHASVLDIAQAHAAAIFLTDAGDDGQQPLLAEAADTMEFEVVQAPIRSRLDAAGKLVLLRSLVVVALGGAIMSDQHDLRLLDDVVAYLRTDA